VNDIKRINIKEFREFGYLQEVNRLFFHPLGLALEIEIDDDGNERLGGVWDYRDDPEGIAYCEDLVNSPDFALKVQAVQEEFKKKIPHRRKKLGYIIQMIDLAGGDKNA